VGAGQPTDADWQKVGEMCLGPTKENVKEGEFKGVELSFMGLNNQNVHNVLFRGLSKAWADYTGATINWIDLAQADYNARLQQSIATGTVDFDVIEMGAPFEGDVCGKGLASVMPDWVKPSRSTWTTMWATSRPPSAPGTARPIASPATATATTSITAPTSSPMRAWPRSGRTSGGAGEWGVPKTWQQVNAATKFLKGKKLNGQDLYGYLDPCKGWGGFAFYFLGSRATAYAKHPDDKRLPVRSGHDEAARQQSGLGARHPGRARLAALASGRPAQRRSGHHGLPAVPRRHGLHARLVGRHRLERQDERHLGGGRRHGLRHPPRLG
jgi:multiple sugar transport system substrate-binding protein